MSDFFSKKKRYTLEREDGIIWTKFGRLSIILNPGHCLKGRYNNAIPSHHTPESILAGLTIINTTSSGTAH